MFRSADNGVKLGHMPGAHYQPKTVQQNARLINPETGEAEDRILQYDIPKPTGGRTRRRRRTGMKYVMIDSRSMGELELTPTEHRVIAELLAVADKDDESRSRITTTLLAQRIGIATSAASRALSALRTRRIIFKEGPAYWRVTPWYAFAGEWADWDAAAKHFPEPVWRRDGN